MGRSSALGLALFLAAPSGCDSCGPKHERVWALCTCDYVTDMDYPGKIQVEVCGEPSIQGVIAKSCASSVGAVLECACRASGRGPCRDDDRCRDVDK